MLGRRRVRTIIGQGKDFDPFRSVRALAGKNVRKVITNYPAPKPIVQLRIVPDAVRKVNLLKSLSVDEREVAQSIMGFVDKNPGAFFDDIKSRAGGKWYKKEILQTKSATGPSSKSAASKYFRVMAPVETATIRRIYAVLVKEKIILGETRNHGIKV